jgi:hypothetical protein
MDKELDIVSGHIDISNKKELKCWCKLLRCSEEDLKHAVLTIGNAAKPVDDFLFLNRQKN